MNIADEKNIKHDNLVPTQDEIVNLAVCLNSNL